MTDEEIRPVKFSLGVNVVDIGDMRIKRGKTIRKRCCNHRRLVYDPIERRVWCKSCESDVDTFDAFAAVAAVMEKVGYWERDYERRKSELEEFEAKHLHRIAAKLLEKEWQKQKTIPCCPHCDRGLLADDFNTKQGIMTKSKALEIGQRRNRNSE